MWLQSSCLDIDTCVDFLWWKCREQFDLLTSGLIKEEPRSVCWWSSRDQALAVDCPALVWSLYWYWHPSAIMNTCANFFGWKWGKVWTSHLRTNQGRVLICWSSKRYNWACPRDEAVFQTSFPASSLFFFLQKSKSTRRYHGPRLNEWLYQDLLIMLLLGLSMCWRGGEGFSNFYRRLSPAAPLSSRK